MNLKKSLMLLIGLCLVMSSTVFADLYYESETVTTGAPMGGASDAQPVLIKTYNNGEAIRIERGNDISIIMLGEGKSYQLNVERKTYSELDLNKMLGGDDEMAKRMKQIVENMTKDMKVEKTDETKEISGYNCTRYNVSMMGTQSEYWVTKDVKGYEELREKSFKLAEKFKDNQLIQNTVGIGSAMEKIEGFPIETTVRMGSMETKSTVKKISNDAIDPSMFKIPDDFVKNEKVSNN